MYFKILANVGKARAGIIKLNDVLVETPAFMPIGTYGFIKSSDINFINNIGVKLILSNIFHLLLYPNIDNVFLSGGIHNFFNWNNLILTDSGGYQIFSLNNFISITNNGIYVNYPKLDNKIFINSDISLNNQNSIGSNIIMSFDECSNFLDKNNVKKSLNLSLNWAKYKKNIIVNKSSVVFGIIQGGIYNDLRKASIVSLLKYNFDSYAIGGLSVGESYYNMFNLLDNIIDLIPRSKPLYLMGVGKPEDLIESVIRGVDMFDCVIPTRNARNGYIYTFNGILNIKKNSNKFSLLPIDNFCKCYCCKNFTVSYLYNLYLKNEPLFSNLVTIHNVFFFNSLMKNLRLSIINNKLENFVDYFYKHYRK